MRKITAVIITILLYGWPTIIWGQGCTDRLRLQVFHHGDGFTVPIWKFSRGVVGFRSVMEVNADGAPLSYSRDDTGWSFLCDGAVAFEGGHCIFPPTAGWQRACKTKWARVVAEDFNGPDKMCYFGFLLDGGVRRGNSTVGGRPVTQGLDDPAPGYFVTTTALTNSDVTDPKKQRHYVDAATIPFIVIPGSWHDSLYQGIDLGDVAWIFDTARGTSAFAIVADTGPNNMLGEGSVALHQMIVPSNGSGLHHPFKRDAGGVIRAEVGLGREIKYVIFPGSRSQLGPVTTSLTYDRIKELGQRLLAGAGGAERVKGCIE